MNEPTNDIYQIEVKFGDSMYDHTVRDINGKQEARVIASLLSRAPTCTVVEMIANNGDMTTFHRGKQIQHIKHDQTSFEVSTDWDGYVTLVLGQRARFQLETGDVYAGDVVSVRGNLITLTGFTAWYHDAFFPKRSQYVDDEVSFYINSQSHISVGI